MAMNSDKCEECMALKQQFSEMSPTEFTKKTNVVEVIKREFIRKCPGEFMSPDRMIRTIEKLHRNLYTHSYRDVVRQLKIITPLNKTLQTHDVSIVHTQAIPSTSKQISKSSKTISTIGQSANSTKDDATTFVQSNELEEISVGSPIEINDSPTDDDLFRQMAINYSLSNSNEESDFSEVKTTGNLLKITLCLHGSLSYQESIQLQQPEISNVSNVSNVAIDLQIEMQASHEEPPNFNGTSCSSHQNTLSVKRGSEHINRDDEPSEQKKRRKE